VLLVVQLSLVCGIFQQPAMSASPGPKPFWPDGRTWAVRTHRDMPMPLHHQWTVKAVVCSCICAWFTRVASTCSFNLGWFHWVPSLAHSGRTSDSSETRLVPNDARACSQGGGTYTDSFTAELKHLENKQSCRAFHCSELWIGYDWIIEDYCVMNFLSFSMNVLKCSQLSVDVSMAPWRPWILPRWQLHLCHQRWVTAFSFCHNLPHTFPNTLTCWHTRNMH
jgi:hypothetical protein